MNRYCVRHAIVGVFVAAAIAGCGGQKPEALLASAKEYLAKNDNNGAVIQLRNALQKDPDLAEARFLLGKTLLASGDPAGAEKELREAAAQQYPEEQVAPPWARALVLVGQYRKVVDELAKMQVSNARGKAELMTAVGESHIALRNPNAARQSYTAALAADPQYAPALRGQARLAGLTGDLNEAAAKIDAALAVAPTDAETLELKAGLLMSRQQPKEALAVYRKALDSKPDLVSAHSAIVSLLMQEKELDEAAKQVAAMKRVAPNHPQTHYLQAWVALRQKDLPTARSAIQQHLRLTPDNPRGQLLAGAIEYELQSYAQAENYLTQVLQRAPRQPLAWRLLIGTYLRTGQAGRALERMQPILDQIKDDSALLALAGEVFMANGDAKQAAEYFEKAAKLDPKNTRSRTGLALSHLAQGDSETAYRELEQAAASGTDLRADFALIAAHVRKREFDKALAAVDRLEQKQPKSALPVNVRGGVLLAKGDVAGARKQFEHALSIDPIYFPAAAQLARLDLAEKKTDAAQARMDAILAKDPKNLAALLGLAELRRRAGAPSQEVVGFLQKAVSAHPSNPMPRLALIRHYVSTKDLQNGMSAAQDAMAAFPTRAEILAAAGATFELAGETDRAISIYRKLATLDTKSPVPLINIASAQFAGNKKDDAIASLRRALELQPDLVQAQQALVGIYLDTGRTKDALAVAHEVQKQRPKHAIGYALEGDVHATQKNWTEATAAYRNGLKHAESSELATRLYSALGAGSGGATAAADFANTWAKNHPQDRLRFAELALAAGQFAQAVQHYRKMLEAEPKNAAVLNNLAWAESRVNDPKAIEHAEEAHKLAPNEPAIMDTLGTLLVEKGDTARGLELLQKASAGAPGAPVIRLNFVKALLKAGQKDAARKEIQALEKLGDKFPAQAEVAQLKKQL
jgi:putative PEP-CTERM system TPR-repeat lipoprotein